MVLAAISASKSSRGAHRGLSLEHTEDVALLHDEQLLAVDLDLGAAPFSEQHAVTGFDIEGHDFARLVTGAGAYGDDLTLHGLFLHRIGDDDAASGLGIFLNAANDDAVVKRTELHGACPPA